MEYTGLLEYVYFFTMCFALATPLWLPIALGAYAIGKRRFSLRMLMVAMTLESVAIGAVAWVVRSGMLSQPVY